MPIIKAQIIHPYFTNLPEDVISNTLNFNMVTPMTLEEAGDVLNPIIRTFFSAVYGSTRLANYVNYTSAVVRYYRMDQPEPRVPYELPMGYALLSPTASDVPTEVACVLSFQGDKLGGTPQARRRGRIYIGGLSSVWIVDSTASAFPTMATTAIEAVASAAEGILNTIEAAGFEWVVWSPTDQNYAVVTNGWVDNAPDTQRRRSVERTARTLWP